LVESGASSESCRVGVFVDWQNCYRTARDAFGFAGSGIDGQVYPYMLARALAKTRVTGQGEGVLKCVRIYSGRASQKRDPKTYAANRRQFQRWESSSPGEVVVVTRTLDYTLGRPREKGIDVQLAIDLVRTTCFEDEHDVAVVVSADTDLLPALELVIERNGPEAIEVATWQGPYWAPKPLSVAGHAVRQHELTRAVYDRLADRTDYNIARQRVQVPYGRRRRPQR
jgi:uncharacterized LabA/DUF88 family protein